MRAVVILAATLLFSCAAPPSPPVEAAPDYPGSPEDLRTCAARGGTVAVRGGFAPMPVCAIRYPDAGRSCADSSQCAGRCLVPYQSLRLDRRSRAGRCEWEQVGTIGCYAEMRSGRPGPVICAD